MNLFLWGKIFLLREILIARYICRPCSIIEPDIVSYMIIDFRDTATSKRYVFLIFESIYINIYLNIRKSLNLQHLEF